MLKAGERFLCLILALAISSVASTTSPNLGVFDIPFSIVLYDQSDTTVSTTTTTTTKPSSATSSTASDSSTKSTVSSSTTPTPSTTTIPTSTIQLITANLTYFLYSQFHNTTGFVSVSVPTPVSTSDASQLTMTYGVVYNKTELNADGMLMPNSSFIFELIKVCTGVSSTKQSFYGYGVNGNATIESMVSSIYSVSQTFNETTWVCSGIECSQTSTCTWNSTTSMATCTDKCSLFTAENTRCTEPSSLPGVYLQGTCAYDANWQPYCDCGMSSGDVMANFYDGYQCVSSTFIVAMAASAGGVLFLMCIVLICVINRQREAIAQAKKTQAKYKASNPPAVSSQQAEVGFTNKAVYEYNDPTINTITKNEVYRSDTRPHSGFEPANAFGRDDDELASAQL